MHDAAAGLPILLKAEFAELLGTRYIDELLALVDSAPDPTAHLQAERDRLCRERDNLPESIAA